ncbi:MAG: hypothetical protein HOP32_06865 [Nitrospira sp.]|nr:hypothetical protein [Nitrospira sp.]
MKKKNLGSSVRGQQAGGSAKLMPDSQIDFSDIPESTEEELRRARREQRKLLTPLRLTFEDRALREHR